MFEDLPLLNQSQSLKISQPIWLLCSSIHSLKNLNLHLATQGAQTALLGLNAIESAFRPLNVLSEVSSI